MKRRRKLPWSPSSFNYYVLIWWEQVTERRREKGDPPITTWNQMKNVARARFMPTNYSCDHFKKLQLLKQGTESVEDYYQEMEIAMIRANVKEDGEQTMARLLNGLNHQVKKIAGFQQHSNLLGLVHQATKAERQVQDDYKFSKYSSRPYGSNIQVSTTPAPTTTRATPTSSGTSSSKQPTTSLSRPSTGSYKPRASSSTTPPTDATAKTSFI